MSDCYCAGVGPKAFALPKLNCHAVEFMHVLLLLKNACLKVQAGGEAFSVENTCLLFKSKGLAGISVPITTEQIQW